MFVRKGRKAMFEDRIVNSIEDGSDGEAGGDTAAEAAAAKAAADAAAAETKLAADAAAEAAAKAAADADGESEGTSEEVAKLLKDLMKHKDRARTTQAERDELAAKLKDVNSVLGDMSLEDVQALVDSRREQERKTLEAQGKYEQIVEQMREQSKATVDALNQQIQDLSSQLTKARETTEEMSVGRAFGDSAFIRESSTLPPSIARKEFGTYFEIEDGSVVPYNKPRGAEGRAPLVDANGITKSFEVAIAELYEKHPDSKSLLRAKQKAGSGSGTSETKIPVQETKQPKVSGVDRILKGLNSATG